MTTQETLSSAQDTPPEQKDASLNTPHMRRILTSSFLGSAIEYYDFLLYATSAAIVFHQVFFVNLSPVMAAFASFGTLAAGYLARPLGGMIFGHFGDRLGRKKMLVLSMVLMGVATTSMGLLPSAASIGVLAPMLLITLRIVQGISVGGEWGGAMLIALEQAPGGKRGFAASFANMGAPAGAALATVAMSIATLLPDEQFLAWGWRVPFLLSALLVAIAMVVRLRVQESPLFQQFEEKADKRRMPVAEVFRFHPRQLTLGVLAGIAQFTMAGMVTVWAVSEAVANGADKTGVLNAKALAAFVMLLTTIISARLCDRIGRKKVLAAGMILTIIAVFPILYLTSLGTVSGYAVAVILGQGLQGVMFGPLGAFIAELFPTKVRYTGSSVAFQTASTVGAGFSPMVATAVMASAGGMFLLGGIWIGVLALCLLGVLISVDSSRKNLAHIA
ncbi:MFS transporter [Corynebacterium halotolerans]|uniref:MFS transporter n=1 Tax=Corynebacterium halotolerans TaxID=225326 RepID=UPI003CFA8695